MQKMAKYIFQDVFPDSFQRLLCKLAGSALKSNQNNDKAHATSSNKSICIRIERV